jgi:hypothetical protein
MRLDGSESEGSCSRFLPELGGAPLGGSRNMIGPFGIVGGRAPLDYLQSCLLLVAPFGHSGTAPGGNQLEVGIGVSRFGLLRLKLPSLRRVVFWATLCRTFGRSQESWTLRLLNVFARRPKKSSEVRPAANLDAGTFAPPIADPPPPVDREKEDESPVWGFTATEALKAEVLDNLPNDLARLFFLASLFDQAVGHYVDYGRAERFGAVATAKAAERAHAEVFRRLTEASLEDLGKLVSAWADAEPEGFATVAKEWRENGAYHLLSPPASEQGESRLFEDHLELAIDMVASRRRRRAEERAVSGSSSDE